MNKYQRRTLRRFRRVQEFLTNNPVPGTAAQLDALSKVILQLPDTGAEQEFARRQTRGETARQRELRRALWLHHLRPIVRIASRTLGTPMSPELKATFTLPRQSTDNDALIQAASAMAKVAEINAAMFIRQGLPADFVPQLRRATAALSDALGARVETVRRRNVAAESVAELVKRGRASLEMLDAIVSSRLESRPELLAAWKTAKRLAEAGEPGTGPSTEAPAEVKAA